LGKFFNFRKNKNECISSILSNTYFWRTYTGAEIDYIEELNNEIKAYEFKFSNKTVSAPKSWTETYPSAFETVNIDNFLSFIKPKYLK
jgi:hypothetical protein